MADDIGAQVRATPGLPEVIADLLGDGLGFSCLGDNDKAMEWALRAYRAGQAAAPDGPRTWALPDGAEARARIVVVVNRRRGSVHGITSDNAEAQRWTRELIDSYRDELAATQYIGLVKVGPGSLFVDPLIDATPADAHDGDEAETGRAPARIDGAGRTGAGAGERVDDAQDDSGGRDG